MRARLSKIALFVAVTMVAACSTTADVPTYKATSCSDDNDPEKRIGLSLSLNNGSFNKNYADSNTTITWEADIKPFLESRLEGHNYNCTTCHSDYKQKETIALPGEVDRIIKSVTPPTAG
jgi:hypothetical protein